MKIKKVAAYMLALAVVLLTSGGLSIVTQAKEDIPVFEIDAYKEAGNLNPQNGAIQKGVFADTLDLSGMSETEAVSAVEAYIDTLRATAITLNTIENNVVEVTAGEFGLEWKNPLIISEAMNLGKGGNLVQRYKALKDLEKENKIFEVEVAFDSQAVEAIINERCVKYNVEAVNASLTKEGKAFNVVPGKTGYMLNVPASVETVNAALGSDWKKSATSVDLVADIQEPKGKTEDLAKIKDVLGSASTGYPASGPNRSTNVANGAKLINGTLLYPGDTFSAYEAVAPFTEERGYAMAGSYLEGMVVESLGGGICQVTSTLYNAVLRAELEVTERFNHSMIVSYVDLSADAAISGTYKDFKFTNNLEYPIYIEGSTNKAKQISFTIYGAETRPKNRTISFESEELSKTVPEAERIIADTNQPVGSINIQSEHIGYTGKYWKVVKVDGVETERTQINKSTYAASPKTATVGIGAADPAITELMKAAIATGSIDYCKTIINNLQVAAAMGTSVAVQGAAAPVEVTEEIKENITEGTTEDEAIQ